MKGPQRGQATRATKQKNPSYAPGGDVRSLRNIVDNGRPCYRLNRACRDEGVYDVGVYDYILRFIH